MVVQSVLIPKKFTLKKALSWMLENGYIIKKIDVTSNYYRFRQVSPDDSKNYYTQSLKNGIKLVIMQ